MPAGTGAVGEEHNPLDALGDIQDSFELHRTRRNPDIAFFHRSPPPFQDSRVDRAGAPEQPDALLVGHPKTLRPSVQTTSRRASVRRLPRPYTTLGPHAELKSPQP